MSGMDELDLEIELAAAAASAAKGKKSLGTRLWENVVGDDDPTTQNFGEKVGSLLNMGGEAMTFGLVGDEASAAVESVLPGVDYDTRLQHYRDQQKITESDHPFLSTAAKIGGAMAAPLGAIGAGAGVLRSALIGAGAGGTYAFMEGEGGVGERTKQAGVGGLLGAVGGAASVPLGRAVSWAYQRGGRALAGIFQNRRMFDGGRLSDEGRATLEALGYNVDELSDDFANAFQRGIREAVEPQQAAAAADLAEFGIPAYRANVTGAVDDFAALERARRGGGVSPRVQDRVRGALTAQDDAMRAAADDIAVGLGRGVRGDQGDAAVTAITAARNARDAARDGARAAYDALEASGAGVTGSRVANLGNSIKIGLERADSPVRFSEIGTPNANSAIAALDDTFANAGSGAVPFMNIERARQDLVRLRSASYRGSNGADQIAMDRVLGAFDDRIDEMMTSALTEGDAATLEAARNARGLWRAYADRFKGDGAASKFIQDMIDEDASPDQVVRWMFSSGKLGTGRFNSTIARGVRDTLGGDSEAWGMIRQAAFRQLFQKPEGTTQWGPQKISANIAEFFRSPATRELSRTLFDQREISQMLRYSTALRRLVPPPGAVNHSGTAYEGARMAREAFRGVVGMLGMSAGGPAGAVGGALATGAAQRGGDWLTSRALLNAAPIVTSAGRAPVAGGVVAGSMGGPALDTARTLSGRGPQR